ncbi:MAG: hypothetical protein Ct9H300mP15_24110 [Gemmatimonadota bacterium]|nr:MAG: hypothetical protein Ct9H300mP15_24110 [Gemmatimonadota bacterium]
MLSELFLMATLGTEPDSLRYNGRMGELEVSPPKLVDPGINVDGLLDEQAWTTAAILGGFTQYVPVEGVEPSEATEIRVFYTDEAIYFGIRAYDSDPGEILARFGERDRVTYNDDWVRIILDTFDDRRQAYAFAINPLGLQSDGLIVEGGTSGFGGRSGGGVADDLAVEVVVEALVGGCFRWTSIRILFGILKGSSIVRAGLEKFEFHTYPCASVKSQNRLGASR